MIMIANDGILILGALISNVNFWSYLIITLVFICPCLAYLSTRERRLVEQILNGEENDTEQCDVKSLLGEINRKTNLLFQTSASCWVDVKGFRYLFFDGIVVFLGSSWRGVQSARQEMRCLVSTSKQAKEALSANPRMFRNLAETDDVAVFYIRRLSEFVKEVQG